MPKLSNDMNQIQNPIDSAVAYLQETQEAVFNSILGPQQEPREPKILGMPVNPAIEQVLGDAQQRGQMLQIQNQVTAPPPRPDTPMPVPPAPPPELAGMMSGMSPDQGGMMPPPNGQPPQGLGNLGGLLGGMV